MLQMVISHMFNISSFWKKKQFFYVQRSTVLYTVGKDKDDCLKFLSRISFLDIKWNDNESYSLVRLLVPIFLLQSWKVNLIDTFQRLGFAASIQLAHEFSIQFSASNGSSHRFKCPCWSGIKWIMSITIFHQAQNYFLLYLKQ